MKVWPGAPAAAGSGLEVLELRSSKLSPGAPGAGCGLEDLKVEVANFRPGAPAAGSGLEGLHVELASFRLPRLLGYSNSWNDRICN